MNKSLTLSVHQLVDFLLRTGDIDNRVYNQETMNEGSRIHSVYQKRVVGNYHPEFLLRETFEVGEYQITLEGRADGIYFDDVPTIEEIKSTVDDLDHFHLENERWHLGQAICYAYMYLHLANKEVCHINLVYIHQVDENEKTFTYTYEIEQLKKELFSFFDEYILFYEKLLKRSEIRNESCETLEFPFGSFRNGQRKLAKYAYGISKNGGVLFVEAPTGIGKTVSTLFPFIKSFKDQENEKIFYLTAKTTGKTAAFDCVHILKGNGFKGSDILITAKDKICFCLGKGCNPDECPFAKGYYTKLREVLTSSLEEFSEFSHDIIVNIAAKYAMCPFELELDLSLFVDVVICDYNYLFDPLVHMERYFDMDASKYLVLVDEAHNLLDRGQDMYSVSLDSGLFKALKSDYKYLEDKKVKRGFSRVNKMFKEMMNFYNEGYTKISEVSHETMLDLNYLFNALSECTDKSKFTVTEMGKEFSKRLFRFIKLYEQIDDTYSIYVYKNDKYVELNLYCLDPSSRLRNSINLVKGAILFSATLSPINYYINVLGGYSHDPYLLLPSPFPKENLKLMLAPKVSVKYKNRDKTIKEVVDYIKAVVDMKIGNYLIFAPSFEYLENLTKLLSFDDADIYIQQSEMDENSKIEFLSHFVSNPKKTTVGVCVVGGTFGEGIDLVNDRLIGVIVIGVGLPTISWKRDLIKDYYDKGEEKLGYQYSYINPGMNRIMQSVGRLIRSEKDRGVALLIDERYLTNEYRDLFKNEWSNYDVVTSVDDLKEELETFWFPNEKR